MKKTYIRARKVVVTVVTTKLYIYNHMNINNKNTKKRYPANTNLLGTDWVPLSTLLFSCTYARNKRAVPTGTHVKICVWVPTNPIITGLTGAVPTVPTVTGVFLYIYGFLGERADGGRADFELTPCKLTFAGGLRAAGLPV